MICFSISMEGANQKHKKYFFTENIYFTLFIYQSFKIFTWSLSLVFKSIIVLKIWKIRNLSKELAMFFSLELKKI